MHGIDLTTQMDIFYHSMNYASKGIIDAACCKAFKRRSAEEARQLIKDLAKCNYKAPSEVSGSSRRLKGSGVIELNRMTAIEAKLDALMNKIGNNERRMYTALEVGIVDERERRKSAKRVQTMRVPTRLRRHSTSMPIGATLSSPTSTCLFTIHQHSGTMNTSHMGEEHSKVKDLDRFCSNIMPYQGSNNNNNR